MIPEPFKCPSVYDWIQACLVSKQPVPFMLLSDIVSARSSRLVAKMERELWSKLTPRTLLFAHFFSVMESGWSSIKFVEVLVTSGLDSYVLETLPEAILAPLQEAIVQCQTEPPTKWDKNLLSIIGREDVNMLLSPGQRPRNTNATILVRVPFNLRHVNLTVSRLPRMKQVKMSTPSVFLRKTQKPPALSMGLLKWTDKPLRGPSSRMTGE